MLYLIASGKAGFDPSRRLRLNGYGELAGRLLVTKPRWSAKWVLTGMFLLIILGATSQARAPQGFAPIAIGLTLTLIHLISIPVTNTSVDPARSTAGRPVRRRLGGFPAVAVLGRADSRCGYSAPLAYRLIGDKND